VFYTYAHYTPDGRLFYIGKGQGKRAYKFYNRGVYWDNVVAKYGKPDVQILANWGSNKEALSHEVLLIACFKELGHKLCNQTDGGEGTTGHKLSDEHKAKISFSQKGKPGKKPSPETLIKLRESHLGQIAWNKGIKGVIKQSQETIAKRTKKLMGRIYNVKFKYIGTHKVTMKNIELAGNPAMKNAGFDPARIRDCANGKRKSHKQYMWAKKILGGENVGTC
jgi:hypothetical protein